MHHDRRLRLGTLFCALALAATSGLGGAQAVPAPSAVLPTAAPLPKLPTTPAGGAPAGQPTPIPVASLAPAFEGPQLPYPAYGSPVPGVVGGSPPPGLPQRVSLQQAIAIGFARSPLLAQTRADVLVAAAEAQLEATGLYPSLTGHISTGHEHEQPGASGYVTGATSSPITSSGGTEFTTNSFSADLSQLIYDGGHLAAGVKAAQHTERAAADTYLREMETVAYNVAVAYYNYLLAARTVQVDVDLVQQDVVQEDLVRASVQAGTEARSDIATAQLQTAQARLALVRQQGTEVADQAALANALGLDAGYDVRPVDDAPDFSANPAPVVPLTTYDLAVRRALALRPDYDSSLQSVIASQYSLKEAKLGLFPTLTATGDLETASTNAGGGAFRNTGQIAAGLSIPLFDQGITAANVKNARAELDLSNANLQNEALSVQLSVKQALSNLVTAYAALDQTQVELQTALVVLESTRAQYRAGVTTLPLLLNAEVGITTAAGDRVSAIYAFRQAEQAYLYAIGPNYDFGSAPPPALGAASPQAKK